MNKPRNKADSTSRLQKGDVDRAIADYSEAIRFRPNGEGFYRDRAKAYIRKREYDLAIKDYGAAIKLDADDPDHYFDRGYAGFYKGDFTAASADFVRGIDLTDKEHSSTLVYPIPWLYLARKHSGQDGAAELAKNAEWFRSKEWPYPVVALYLGRRSAEEMLSAAVDDKQRCEAQFYLGE